MQYALANPELEYKEAEQASEGFDPGKDTAEIKRQLSSFGSALTAFQEKMDGELKQMKRTGTVDPITKQEIDRLTEALTQQKSVVDEMRLELQRPTRELDEKGVPLSETEQKHRQLFTEWFCKGRSEAELAEFEQKQLSVGSDPDGGMTVPETMDSTIDRVVTEISDMRTICRVVNVTSASWSTRTGMGGATGGWVAEKDTRPETDTPTLETRSIPVHELYAMPSATQSLLDDSAMDIPGWLGEEVGIEFARMEGEAFINGNGATRPRGILQYPTVAEASWAWGSIGYTATGVDGDWADSSSDPGAETTNIVDLVYSLKKAFRRNARYLCNRATVGSLMKLRDADGRQLWASGLQLGQPDRLMNYPITEMEDMPDIGSDAFALAFGDFRRAYTVVNRIGTRVLRDPFTSKPNVLFYTTRRLGGGLINYEAVKFLKFGTS